MTKLQSFYDHLGKSQLASLFDWFNVPYTFTDYKYDKVDVYFGRSSVAEIKCRRDYYDTYLIEDNKLKALESKPCSSAFYVVVFNDDIWFWKTSTIRSILPVDRNLPINPERTEYRTKTVRYLPIASADFHFVRQDDGSWKLIKFN